MLTKKQVKCFVLPRNLLYEITFLPIYLFAWAMLARYWWDECGLKALSFVSRCILGIWQIVKHFYYCLHIFMLPYHASHIVASLSLLWPDLVCGTFIRSNGMSSLSFMQIYTFVLDCISTGSNFIGSFQALPQFGIHSLVRVCSNCYNDASR